ncbi:MAG: 30S ribosomal protein S16 [Gemmatimonadales bacterium]|jgi:small subunit ribosomal protein S16
MATRIRLKKVGRKKQASFRIVVAGGMHARGGRITETIGKYNPRTQPSYIEVDAGRALHWLREGAQMSESVNALFRQAGILEKYAKGDEAGGVVVIGDPQGKTILKETAASAPAPETAGVAEPAKSAPAPETAGKAQPKKTAEAKAEAKAAEPEAAEGEAEEGEAAEGEAEEKQDAGS